MDPWKEFVKQAAEAVELVFGQTGPLEIPTGGQGDLAFACFGLAKQLKKSPKEIADSFKLPKKFSLIERAESINGYVNFFINWEAFGKEVLVAATTPDFGHGKSFTGRALVEFPSVNPNKPWHIGHARNAVLGDTIANLLSSVGYEVLRTDYIDDLGLQIAKVAWGMKKFPLPVGKFDHALGELYVEVEKAADGAPEEIKEILRRMEKNPAETRALAERCLASQHETAYRFGVFHDLAIFESDIVAAGLLEKALELMKKTKAIYTAAEGEKSGCLVANLAGYPEFASLKDPEVVLLRSDGTATYTAKDIAFQLWKFGLVADNFHYKELTKQPNGKVLIASAPVGQANKFQRANLVINVIGAEQAHPQRLVYRTLETMGFEEAFRNSFHLAYQHVFLPEGKFSGRQGTWIGYAADDVLNEAKERALEEVKTRGLAKGEEEKIAEAVATGAVRYALLKSAPEKRIVFAWKEVLSFEGNAAPYLQYAHARACRILEKANKKPKPANVPLTQEEEALLKHISRLPTLLVKTASSMKQEVWGTQLEIHLLAEYAFQLAVLFNRFYVNCPVIGSAEEENRLAIVVATKTTLHNILAILGVPAIEKM